MKTATREELGIMLDAALAAGSILNREYDDTRNALDKARHIGAPAEVQQELLKKMGDLKVEAELQAQKVCAIRDEWRKK